MKPRSAAELFDEEARRRGWKRIRVGPATLPLAPKPPKARARPAMPSGNGSKK